MNFQEEQYAFYHELGVAMTQWAFVESALRHIVMACAESATSAATLVTGYHAIENFRSKLAYVDAIVRQRRHADKQLLERWKSLCARVEKLSSRRNELAHGEAAIVEGAPPGSRLALTSKGVFKGKSGSLLTGALTIQDVAQLGHRFSRAWMHLQNFCSALKGSRELYPEAEGPEPRRPAMLTIEARMRVANGRQLRPNVKLPTDPPRIALHLNADDWGSSTAPRAAIVSSDLEFSGGDMDDR